MKHYQLKRRPKNYPITEQQENFIKALRFCHIKKGMKKAELQDRMKNCIPDFFKDLKEQEKAVALEGVALDNVEPKEQENAREREKEEDYALQPLGL